MEKTEMKAKMDALESQFLSKLAFPDGGRINRANLRNVDCLFVNILCAVFSNKEGKIVLVPFSFRGRNFPTSFEVSQTFIPELVEWLIASDASTDQTQKDELSAYVPEWMETRRVSPQNAEKIAKYEALKAELEEKGLI